MQARILYRDGLMLVIDKPAGLPVHRGPKGGASLEDFFEALRFGLPQRLLLCVLLSEHRRRADGGQQRDCGGCEKSSMLRHDSVSEKLEAVQLRFGVPNVDERIHELHAIAP